jgi:hypothetical protein
MQWQQRRQMVPNMEAIGVQYDQFQEFSMQHPPVLAEVCAISNQVLSTAYQL